MLSCARRSLSCTPLHTAAHDAMDTNFAPSMASNSLLGMHMAKIKAKLDEAKLEEDLLALVASQAAEREKKLRKASKKHKSSKKHSKSKKKKDGKKSSKKHKKHKSRKRSRSDSDSSSGSDSGSGGDSDDGAKQAAKREEEARRHDADRKRRREEADKEERERAEKEERKKEHKRRKKVRVVARATGGEGRSERREAAERRRAWKMVCWVSRSSFGGGCVCVGVCVYVVYTHH